MSSSQSIYRRGDSQSKKPSSPKSPYLSNTNSSTNDGSHSHTDLKDTNKKAHGRSRSFDYIMNKDKTYSPKHGKSSMHPPSPKAKPPPQRSPHAAKAPSMPTTSDLEPSKQPPYYSSSGNLEAEIELPKTPRGSGPVAGGGNASAIPGINHSNSMTPGGGDMNSIASYGNYSITECPTELHRACYSKTATISQLRTHLLARPSAASMKDSAGRLPLHILSLNKELFYYHSSQNNNNHQNHQPSPSQAHSTAGSQELSAFTMELFYAYPKAVVQLDSDGRLPFTYAIHDWLDAAHDRDTLFTNNNPSSVGADIINDPESIFASTNPSAYSSNNNNNNAAASKKSHKKSDSFDSSYNYSASKKMGKHSASSKLNPSETESLTAPSTAATAPASRRNAHSKTSSKNNPNAKKSKSHGKGKSNRTTSGKQRSSKQPGDPRGNSAGTGEDRSVATATLSQMDGSASYDMNSVSGWTLDDAIPQNVRLDPMALWDFQMLSKILNALQSQAMSGTYTMEAAGAGGKGGNTNTSTAFNPKRDFAGDIFRIDRTGSFPDQGSLSSGNGGAAAAGVMISPPKMLRIASPNNSSSDEDIGNDPVWLANILISGVASVPSILKIILVMSENDARREKIMSYSMVKAILNSHYSVGHWLVNMLEHYNEAVSSAAVNYLEYVSSSFPVDVRNMGGSRYPMIDKKDQLYTKIGNLDHFLISLLGLKHQGDVKRGASTEVVQYVLNWKLSTSPVLVVALSDLIFHFTLIVTFQHFSNSFLEGNGRSKEGLSTYYLTFISIMYLLVRKLSHFSVMLKLSWISFFRYCFRFLDWLDVTALLLALACILMMEIRLEENVVPEHWFREFIAVTTGLIWGKFVGFMYAVNLDVKFYICAIGQNIKNLRWALALLAVCIFSFSQIMNVILSSPLFCGEKDAFSFCNQNSYIQVYSILLGMFDEQEFTATVLSGLLFVLFSFFTVVVILSTMIAITVKTFTSLSGRQPFGDTRLIYFAEVKAFQSLILGQWSLVQYCSIVLFLSSIAAVVLLSVETMREVLLRFHDDKVIITGAVILLIFIWVSIVAFFSHVTFYDFMEVSTGTHNTHGNNVNPALPPPQISRRLIKLVVSILSMPIRFAVKELLGIKHPSGSGDYDNSMFQLNTQTPNIEQKDTDLHVILSEMKRVEKEMKETQNRTYIEIMAQVRSMTSDAYMGSQRR